ncbi:MAG: hypothetical protein SGI99_10745 [Pseudomonadota bacterium]|nr:hypothetical protein [Pseudomonadota bacterium]
MIAVLLLQGSVSAWAADVGMITQISGDVSITAGGRVQAAVPFYKVNAGDRMTLGSTARLQVVYFGNGRQEIWSGTGQVEVGNLESKSTINPQVSQLPPLVINQLAKTPAAGQNGKAGMIRVRSLAKPDAAHLDKQYKELKSTVVSGDTTPEVFLLSGLIEMKEFSRAKEVLADLGSKSGYKAVIDHFSPIVAAGMPK